VLQLNHINKTSAACDWKIREAHAVMLWRLFVNVRKHEIIEFYQINKSRMSAKEAAGLTPG
jgi:hypothetical protein